MAASTAILDRALDKDYIRKSVREDEVYVCVLCNKAGTRETIITHLNTDAHQKRVTFEENIMPQRNLDKSILRGDVQEGPNYHCVLCDADLRTKETAKKHLDTEKHTKTIQAKQREILQADIDSRYIREPANAGGSYSCTLCNIQRRGEPAILEHLRSTKHQAEKLAEAFATTLNLQEE